MMNANWSFYAPFILIKTIDFWLRLNIFIFDNHSLLRAEIVLNPIMDQTYIFFVFWALLVTFTNFNLFHK